MYERIGASMLKCPRGAHVGYLKDKGQQRLCASIWLSQSTQTTRTAAALATRTFEGLSCYEQAHAWLVANLAELTAQAPAKTWRVQA